MQTIESLKQAIAQDSSNPEHHYNLGGAYLAQRQIEAAKNSYAQALALAPGHPQILLQLGNTANIAKQYQEAITHFSACLQSEPSNSAAYYNMGNAYRDLGQHQQAVQAYQQAIQLVPKNAEAHNNLGNVYRELGQLDQAIASYETALSHQPDLHHALAHLIHQKQHICDWDGLDGLSQQLRTVLQNYPQAQIAPFAFLAMPNTSMAEQLHCANQWAQQRFASLLQQHQPFTHALQPHEDNKIKVAYLASDFRLHPLAYLITELLAAHDRDQFEIYAYSATQDDSAENKAIRQAVDTFVDIEQMTDDEVATHMHHQDIDILVDLTGYTKNSRTRIVALKPAPISINWLGFPGSMGQINGESLFDYIFVDETIATNSDDFSEACLYLPCYQPNNANRPLGNSGTKTAHHLPDDAFVFCCFNQTFKITSDIFSVWMQLLTKVENSVLWLLDCNEWAKANLLAKAHDAGIASARIIFAPRMPIADHMARHEHADLFLDTLPYNAHTTASDALYMGVTMVTCTGNTFAGRVSTSLLKQLQLDTCITGDLNQYAEKAYQIATSAEMHQTLKEKTKNNAKLLFNPTKFVSNVESHYQTVYKALLST